MPLSNATSATLAGTPYWDDYDATKGFYRILNRPKFPVQTRELNQVQSIFQNQVEQLATSLYQEGAAITGGEQVYANNVTALQVIKTDTIDIANFYSTTTGRGGVVRGVTSGAEAKVLQVARQPTEVYSAIIIASLNDKTFQGGESITITFGENTYTMTTAPALVVNRPAAIFSVREGVYFLMGHLVHVPQQTVVLSSSSNAPSARIGFEVATTFVTPEDDASLLDPALNTTNYAAPGAHRLKITATLAFRAIDTATVTQVAQNASENFVEIARVGGVITPVTNTASLVPPSENTQVPPVTEDVLARRTYDESGDYVVRPFSASATNHYPPSAYPNGIGRISGNSNSTVIVNASATSFTSQVDPGDVLLVNGEQRRIVTVTNNSQLTINAAFSVDFANSAFSFIDDDKLNLELSAGKAYIRGYEYETLGTTKLEVPRARTTANIDNGQVSTYFGPSVQIKRANGMFNVAATERVDLHCVDYADVKNSTSVVYGASRIGTARVRSQVYVTGNGDANTLYRLYLAGTEFETKTYQINTSAASADTNLTSVLTVNQSTNSITLTQNIATGYGANTWIFPQTANAFIGSTVRLYGIYGETLYYDVVQSTFANAATAQAASVTLTFSAAGLMDRINTSANVVVSFNEKSIRGFATSNTKAVGATVANESRLGLIASGNTVMGGTEYVPMLFKMREDWISPTSITEEYFSSVYRASGLSNTGSNATHTTYQITAPTGATFPAVIQALGHTIFTVSNATSAVSLAGAAVALNGDRSVATLDILTSAVGTSATITVLGKIEVASNTATTSVRRAKIFRAGNTTGRTVNATGYLESNTSGGQIAINNATALHANASFRVVGLGVTDAVTLQRVYAVTNANAAITNTSAYIDITERYDLDTGQRSWCYDHSALVLKPGYMHYSANQMLVVVDMFTHVGTSGYFTANSYADIDYGDIPNFTNPETGKTIPLRDYIDFRPTRQEDLVAANTAYAPYVGSNQTFNTQAFYPHPDETFQMDYAHYLGRVDKVVLTIDRELKVIAGLPSVVPAPPADPEQSMTLYIVTYPPYTANAELVQIEAVEHRRYTMRDIGRLEKRIGQLEYYVQLSQLEDRTLANPELDEDDVERFKNGILIDPFSSHAIANVDDDDYHASIDENKRELRPAFVSQGFRLGAWEPEQSTNVIRGGVGSSTNSTQEEVGRRIFPTYTTRNFVSQVLATKSLSLNPFGTGFWQGNVKLDPATDVWFDTVRDPNVSLNLYNENDNWNTKTFGTVWNDWQTLFKGIAKTETERTDASSIIIPFVSSSRNDWTETALDSLVTRQDTVENRTGSTITAKASKKTAEVLDRVIDTTVVPSMRLANIAFVAAGLKPGTTLRATFDEVDVTNYVERASEIRLASNADAQTFIVGETVSSSSGTNTGYGRIIAITGDTLRVGNVQGRFFDGATNAVTVTASLSSLRDTPHTPVTVSEYVSYAGPIQGVTNSTTFILDTGASAVNDAYTNEVVYITTGPGAGQRTTITDYDGASKTVTVSPALATLPTTASRYSIGNVKADPIANSATLLPEMSYNTPSVSSRMSGAAFGMFFLPGYGHITSSTSLQRNADTREITGVTYAPVNFGIGRRVFRLSDAASIDEATTYAEAIYEVAGQTKTIQTDIVNTRGLDFTVVPFYNREGSLVATTVDGFSPLAENRPQLSLNPVAQTFVVDRNLYPSGLYVASVDLFFTRKDAQKLPVFVRLSPTLNGFPATDVILGSVVRHDVNVVPTNTAPDASNPDHYTRFTFANPVYLQAGVEYALVVSTPSAEYEVMVSELGRNAIGTSRRVSEQPYVRSLFRSQNSRTWKPQPIEDLTFVLHRAVFSTEQATAVFKLDETPKFQPYGGRGLSTYANGVFEFDLYNVDTGHIDFTETITNSSYQLRLTSPNDTQTVVTTKINQNLPVSSRAKIQNTNSVQFIVSFKTDADSIAPMYDTSRFNIVAIQNLIDNGQLYANGVTIVNPGQLSGNTITNPYFSNTVNVAVTGTTANGATSGSGGVLTLTINSLGQVSSVVVATNGSGYLENVSINNSPTGVAWTTNPVFVYRGETSSSVSIFGERKSRYITRRVNLADEFDAADLKVYLSANRPPEANIDVYYKVLANGDRESFDDKNWVRMLLRDSQQNVFSANDREFKEYEYRTVANTAAYVSNSVEYTRFQSFAVKIVLRSTNTITVPRVRNLRAIALDS